MRNNKDYRFLGQYSNEIVLGFFRHHWILVLPHLLIILFFISLLFSLLTVLPNIAFERGLTVYLLPFVMSIILLISFFTHVLFIIGIKYFLNVIIITNLRIVEVKKSIFLKDFQDSLLLEDILDVKRDQKSIWENILGYGNLLITLQSSERILPHVPNPNYHFRLINQAKQGYSKVLRSQEKEGD